MLHGGFWKHRGWAAGEVARAGQMLQSRRCWPSHHAVRDMLATEPRMCLDLNLGRAPRRIWPSDPTPKCCSMHSFSATVRLADTNARAKASQAADGLVCFVSRMRVGHRQCTTVKRCAISS